MFKNFLKIACRNFLRNKSFSSINIIGLAIGMASAILIFLWIQNEYSHDKFHANSDRLYIAHNRDIFNGELHAWSQTSKPLAPALKQEFPEVEDAARMMDGLNFLFTINDTKLNVNGSFTDSGFLHMFSFPLISGNPNTALSSVNQIVITEKLSKKLFGKENAMGKVIKIDSTDLFTVSGVLKDLPNNTQFTFEYLLPWSYMKKICWDDNSWGNNSIKTYILLKTGVSQSSFDKKIKYVTISHTKNDVKATTQVFTHLFSDSWLYSRAENGVYVGGRIERVKLFSIIAGFILLIACINFMNLSTARSEKRAKEVGIRKTIGAEKSSLIFHFIGESIFLSFFSGVLALIIVVCFLTPFNKLVNKELFLDFTNPLFWLCFIGFIAFTGLIAGSYPAFYLSSYQPVKVLKGTFKTNNVIINPRKVLVVIQFTFAIALIICTLIIQHQIEYAQARDVGYTRNNLIYTELQGDIGKNYDLIKNDLINKGAAVSVNKSMNPITQRYSDGWGFSWPGSMGEDDKVDFIRMATDADFIKTMGVSLIEGRDIDINKYPGDSTALLINETAKKVMRLREPLGAIVKGDGHDWKIVGVVKDFIFESPYEKVNQLFVMGPKSWFNVMHIKLNQKNSTKENLVIVEQVFKQYNPQYPFVYNFVDKEYEIKFDDEKRIGSLAGLFSGLTIFISCLGLFGLATYMAENRIKEIGVRKVLGASVLSITSLLSKDFLKLVIISFCIACPFAWLAMNKWLEEFSFRITIEWWVFIITGILSILIAISTVSFQAIKAAIANPVKSLRTE